MSTESEREPIVGGYLSSGTLSRMRELQLDLPPVPEVFGEHRLGEAIERNPQGVVRIVLWLGDRKEWVWLRQVCKWMGAYRAALKDHKETS